jgi:hypothetical protein
MIILQTNNHIIFFFSFFIADQSLNDPSAIDELNSKLISANKRLEGKITKPRELAEELPLLLYLVIY